MKIIFLDIDGVLNFKGTEALAPSGRTGIIDKKVSLLYDIIKTTNAKVVLLQSWGKEWNRDSDKCTNDGKYLDRKMIRRGIHILDKIDTLTQSSINDWLKRNDHVTNAVVLFSQLGLSDINIDKDSKTILYALPIDNDIGLSTNDVTTVIDLLGA